MFRFLSRVSCVCTAAMLLLVGSAFLLPHRSLVGVAHAAKLDPAVCANLARGKAYKEASSCFLRIAKSLDKPNLSKVERKLKGLYLINAAKLMERTAGLEKKSPVKAYYREQATGMYKQYLKEKLCTQQYRCQEISGKLYSLIKAIGYAQLTIVIGPKAKGKISFQGYKYESSKAFPPNISMKLRPGKYRLIVEFSDKRSKIMSVDLAPNKNKIMTLNAPKALVRRPPPRPRIVPKPKASAPAWAWVALSVGVAAAIVSPIMFGLGMSEVNGAEERRGKFLARSNRDEDLDFDTVVEEHDDILGTHELAETLFIVGWVMAGVGAVGITVGIIGIVTAKPKAPPVDPDAKLPSKQRDQRLVFERFSF